MPPFNWNDELTREYLTIDSKYKFIQASLKQYHGVKLNPSLSTTLHTLVQDFFIRSLKHTHKIFLSENKGNQVDERSSRVVLSEVLKRYGGVTEAQINNFIKESLDVEVVSNTNQVLTERALAWFEKTNSLIQKIDQYTDGLKNQINYLSTIFDTVLNKVKEDSFTLDSGYTKLEIARFTGYIKAVQQKRKELEGVRDEMHGIQQTWDVKYTDIKGLLTAVVDGFGKELLPDKRHDIFQEGIKYVQGMVNLLTETNTNITIEEAKFKSLKSGLDELPYCVYYVYRNLAYIEQYIGYVKGGEKLVEDIKEHKKRLDDAAKEYHEYYNKVDIFHRFVDHFRYNLCYEFNRRTVDRVSQEVLLDYKGIN